MSQEGLPHPAHTPVLYHEVIALLQPSSPGHYLDCTAGAGGHSRGILEASAPAGSLLALDLDADAVALTRRNLSTFGPRAIVQHASYLDSAEIIQEIGWSVLDGILLDLGVSSMQLDQPERGFSFRSDGPLDMRFDQGRGRSAADLINKLDESELAEIIWKYGEERYSRRVAKAILRARPVETSAELASVVRSAVGNSAAKLDPATRTFQALRIAVNDELHTIEAALPRLIALLHPGGRIAVISFHSLEDRLVKLAFQKESKDCICPPEQPICTCEHHATLKIITRRPVSAESAEIEQNPRARSAKLRVAQKL